MREPQFIYFDLGNVLLHFSHDRACTQMAEVSGVTSAVVRDVVFGDGLENQYERGELTTRQFYEEFCDRTQTNPNFDALVFAASDIFTLNTAMQPLVSNLLFAGYQLGILSNTCEAHWQFVTSGRFRLIAESFRVNILSYEVGAMKPDSKIYQVAIEEAGVDPESIFFMDDRPENVAGALAAGIDAVQFTDVPTLNRELLSRGVKCNF